MERAGGAGAPVTAGVEPPLNAVRAGPYDAPAWVHIVPGEKVWEVSCDRCGAWWITYAITVARDPDLIQRLANEHRLCSGLPDTSSRDTAAAPGHATGEEALR